MTHSTVKPSRGICPVPVDRMECKVRDQESDESDGKNSGCELDRDVEIFQCVFFPWAPSIQSAAMIATGGKRGEI